MKTDIRLAILNERGSIAGLENEDGSITLTESHLDGNPAARCRQAAKTLRALATKFDNLAKEKDPFKCDTQKRVNRRTA